MKVRFLILFLLSIFVFSGCGWIGSSSPEATTAINVIQPMKTINQNTKAIAFMVDTIQKYSQEYTEEEQAVLIQARGSLKSILEYATLISSQGQANKGNVTTLWNMAQIEYYKIKRVINTQSWGAGEQAVYEMLTHEAQRCAIEIDVVLAAADSDTDRQTMDWVLAQIKSAFEYMLL